LTVKPKKSRLRCGRDQSSRIDIQGQPKILLQMVKIEVNAPVKSARIKVACFAKMRGIAVSPYIGIVCLQFLYFQDFAG
jgi:hypothetical protein